MVIKFLILFISLSGFAYAETCPERPAVGFGFASLDQMRNQINKSYSIKEHCEKHQYIFSHIAEQKSDLKEMKAEIAKSKVIILGEEHNTPAQRDYGQILKDLKKQNSNIDCLFLEWNPNDVEAQKLIAGERPDSINYLGHYELVTAARAAQIKIFAVDNRDKNTKYDSKDVENYIRDSNLRILKNIKQLLDSGSCQTSVLLIGKAHVEHPQIQIDPKDSIKTFLKSAYIDTMAINLVYTGKNVYADNFDQQWNWNICPDNSPIAPLKEQVVIGRDQLNKEAGMTIYRVNTFDYYLFLPEVETKRLYP